MSRPPALLELRLSGDGRLWVRTIDARFADIHPAMLFHVPDMAPPTYIWDVFDAEGVFEQSVEMPRTFTPMLFERQSAVGFYELESGEIVVATVRWRGP